MTLEGCAESRPQLSWVPASWLSIHPRHYACETPLTLRDDRGGTFAALQLPTGVLPQCRVLVSRCVAMGSQTWPLWLLEDPEQALRKEQ